MNAHSGCHTTKDNKYPLLANRDPYNFGVGAPLDVVG